MSVLLLLLVVSTIPPVAWGWIPPHGTVSTYHKQQRKQLRHDEMFGTTTRFQSRSTVTTTTTTVTTTSSSSKTRLYGWFDSLIPYESKIPPELKDEIYEAEANTPAGKDRKQRVTIYICCMVLGILLAAFNGFLTELRATELLSLQEEVGSSSVTTTTPNTVEILTDAGFGWVTSNPITSFLFTNKIGGGLSFLVGGGAWLLAESEMDTKRLNAERIYEELERRRNLKKGKGKNNNNDTRNNTNSSTSTGGSSSSSSSSSDNNVKKKKRRSKEQKRLGALSEVMMSDVDTEVSTTTAVATMSNIDTEKVEGTNQPTNNETGDDNDNNNKKGLFGQMKDLYEKADSMAASQALLLNKKLEDAGVVEKITDETGLRVIGKDAVVASSKIQQKQAEVDSDEK